MRKWNVLGVLICCIGFAGASQAQVTPDVQKKLDDLDKRIAKMESNNDAIRESLNADGLDAAINKIAEKYAGRTTVKSNARPITITGEFRNRAEVQIGDAIDLSSVPFAGLSPLSLDDETEGYSFSSRLRIGLLYQFKKNVKAFAELQANFTWGDSGAATRGSGGSPFASPYGFSHGGVTDDIHLYQGWLELDRVFKKKEFSLTLGRQEIVLGNQFQFGNADWFNGWTFDGVVGTWKQKKDWRLVGIIAKLSSIDGDLNQVGSYLSAHDDDELYALYLTINKIKDHELDLYWIYVNGHGVNSVSTLGENLGGGRFGANAYFHTIGARIGGTFKKVGPGGLDWNLEIAYQSGTANGTLVTDVNGLALEAEVGLVVAKKHKVRIYARFLYASGPEDDETGYIPLYPNRHSNAGFRARYGITNLLPMANVMSIQVGGHFSPRRDLTFGVTAIYSTTDEEDTIVAADDEGYGYEINAWGEYRHSKSLVISAGFAVLVLEDEGEILTGLDDDTQFFFYLQARVSF